MPLGPLPISVIFGNLSAYRRSALALMTSVCLTHIPTVNAATNTEAAENDLWDTPMESLGKIRVVSIASGTATPLDKAAAITTVITAEDIAAMGANDLEQVLRSVPGLHINHSDQAFFSKFNFRGLNTVFNAETLLMFNGVPFSELNFGNRGNVWGGMPIKSIARIEVIRGPGSALYGADAFAGVINIITKSARDIPETVSGIRVGSDDTYGGWIEAGAIRGSLDYAMTLEVQQSQGWEGQVEHDNQSNFDQLFSTQASLTPGSVDTSRNQVELHTELGSDHWRWRFAYQDRSEIGTGPGIAMALDPYGKFGSERVFTDFRYEWKNLFEAFDLESRINYARMTQDPENNIILFPPGAFGGAYPDGFIGNPGFKEDQARFELSGRYQGVSDHLIRFGTGFFWGDLFEVTEQKNFNPDFSPKGSVVDVSDNPAEVWMPTVQRTNYYAYAQDEWHFADNWHLTSGVRYDHYSDFGGTINPRMALVWATTDTVTTKALYGRAFRAPSFNELYVVNNPSAVGDPNLGPQTIDTYELALSQQVTPTIFYSINTFYYHTDDLISAEALEGVTSRRYANIGQQSGHGAELETTYSASQTLTVYAYYAWQNAKDDRTGANVANVPQQLAYARAIWSYRPEWQLTPQLNWVGEQARTPGDARAPLEDYVTLDLTVRKQNLAQHLDLMLTAQNVFDVNVKDPSPAGAPTEVPGDFPMAGLTILGEIQYRF